MKMTGLAPGPTRDAQASGTARRARPTLGRWLMWASPAAIALYSPLALLAVNQLEVESFVAARSVLASLGLAVAVTALCGLLLRPAEKAVVLACAIMIAFFTYGHIYDALKQFGPATSYLARHRYLFPLDTLLIFGLAFLLARTPTLRPALARWLTAFGWILLAFPLIPLLQQQGRDWMSSWKERETSPSTLAADGEDLPDVFYIILDGYGRSDILKTSYGFDNTPFLDFLRSRGFYVADKAMSNYSRTLLSLTSSLNMDQLDQVLGEVNLNSVDRTPLYEQLHHNRVFGLFRSLGYSTVAFETGYHPTELTDADEFLTPNYEDFGQSRAVYAGAGLNEFEGLFLQTTMATVAFDFYLHDIQRRAPGVIDYEYAKHRTRVLFTISSLSDIAARPSAHFVFAHIISPHPPFVFGPRGEKLIHQGVFSLGDGCCQGDDYVQRYVAQMQYLNGALRVEIDEILEASAGDVIIILQGDHGPAGLLDWGEPSDAGIRDRMAILNAYHLPRAGADALYPAITPVNTFRVILDRYFGGDFDLLEDASYFSATSGLSDMIRVAPSP